MLDFSMEADELPTEVDAALEAEEVLSASVGKGTKAARQTVSAAVRERGIFSMGGVSKIYIKMGSSPREICVISYKNDSTSRF